MLAFERALQARAQGEGDGLTKCVDRLMRKMQTLPKCIDRLMLTKCVDGLMRKMQREAG